MRAFGEKLRDPIWWLEQTGHFAACALIAFCVGILWAPGAGIVIGMLCGMGYEALQNFPDEESDHKDLLADLLAEFSGAIMGGLLSLLI